MMVKNRGMIREHSKSRLSILGISMALLAAGALTGCIGGDDTGGDGAEKSLTMAVPAWTGEEIRSHMVKQILEEELGYSVKMNTGLQVAPAYQAVASGSADIFMGAWLPIQQSQYDRVQDKVHLLANNLEDDQVTFNMAVPKYIHDQGITSWTDLAENAEMFDYKMYGFDPGAGMSITAQENIEKNLYGLGDWEYVTASEAAMLAQYDKAVKNGEPVITAAWSPHYMFVKWQGDQQMVYLEDPGDPEHDGETWYQESSDATVVSTIASDNLVNNHPDVKAFLENFKMDSRDESALMLEVQEGASTQEVAEQFLADNPEKVEEWLSGVESTQK